MYAVQRICLMVSDKTVSARDAGRDVGRNALQGQLLQASAESLPRKILLPLQETGKGAKSLVCKVLGS